MIWRLTQRLMARVSAGGYCGPAVKPIALNMVAQIARTPETHGLPISGIGGVTTWRDAAEFLDNAWSWKMVILASLYSSHQNDLWIWNYCPKGNDWPGLSSWMDEKIQAIIL